MSFEKELTAALSSRGRDPKSLSIIVPCFNEQDVLGKLYQRLSLVLADLHIPYEIIAVDDGSKDLTWSMLTQMALEDEHFKIARLSRNYGHQMALTCGLDLAGGEVVLILDADLQDPPELLPAMLAKWKEGYGVVYGRRSRRKGESPWKLFFAYAFYRLISRIAKVDIPQDAGDFRLMDRKAVDALLTLRERHRFIRGLVSWIGFPQTAVRYERQERAAGESKYPVRKSLKLALDAITGFSGAPLRLALYFGMLFGIVAACLSVSAMWMSMRNETVPSYILLLAAVFLVGSLQSFVLGVMGEYLGRILEQGQGRPLYILDEVRGTGIAKESSLLQFSQEVSQRRVAR